MSFEDKPNLYDTMDVRRAPVLLPWWRRRLTWGVAAGALLAIAAVWAWRLSDGSVAEVARSEVWLGTVERGTFVVQVQATGRLVPATSRWIAAPAGGVIDQVLVTPGQRVSVGTPLVKLANPTVLNAAQSAAADLAAAEAGLLAKKQEQENAVLSERSTIEGIKVEVESAAMHLKADGKLAEQGIVPRFQYQDEKLKFGLMQQRLRFEQERLANLESGNRALLRAEDERVRQERALAALKQAEAEQLIVRAPITGQIEQISAEPGQQLAAGANLARISTPDALKAEVKVSQYDAGSVAPGQVVSVDTHDGVVAGRVARVDPTVKDGLVTVDVSLTGKPPASARVDQSVDAAIRITQLHDALYVSRPANVHAASSAEVFVLGPNGDLATRHAVRFGVGSTDRIQVLAGLVPGERVVLSDVSAYSRYRQLRLR